MQNFFQVPSNTPRYVSHNILSIILSGVPPNIIFNFIFVVSFSILSVVPVVIFHNIFPDATSNFNFRYSFLIGNNLVCDSVNHIFVVCNYYIIIYYFLNIIIPYLYNILYYIII